MNQKRVYIAGPLFSAAEREYNNILNSFLEKAGFSTFLPQRDGYELCKFGRDCDPDKASACIFAYDLEQLKNADILVLVMDGRVPDEGACVEVGMAFAWGKECYGLKTDCRTLMDSQDNPMILGALQGRVARSFEELLSMIC